MRLTSAMKPRRLNDTAVGDVVRMEGLFGASLALVVGTVEQGGKI